MLNQLPPELKTPGFIQQFQWIFNPTEYMESGAQLFPELFTAKPTGSDQSVVFVQNPQALQYILTNDRKIFPAEGKINQYLAPILGDYSLIMIDGDRHKKRRQLLMPSFHGERMQTYAELIEQITQKIFDELPKNKTFIAREVMQQISLQVIVEVIFGVSEGELSQQIKEFVVLMSKLFESPFSSAFMLLSFLQKDLGKWTPWGNYLDHRQKLDQLLLQEIERRRNNPNHNGTDILTLLMSAKDEEGNGLTNNELRDELILLLFAGHETTANAMGWGLYWLHKKAEIKEKLRAEINNLGKNPDPLSITKLAYLTAVAQETLRIHPVAMLTFPRVAQKEVNLLDQKIAPETILYGCIYLLHQREDLYPNHQEFIPERFIERQYSPYEYMPFGGGVRRCLGETLAWFEMKLVLATVISNYQLKLVENEPEIPRRRGITLTPSRGVKMIRI